MAESVTAKLFVYVPARPLYGNQYGTLGRILTSGAHRIEHEFKGGEEELKQYLAEEKAAMQISVELDKGESVPHPLAPEAAKTETAKPVEPASPGKPLKR